MGLSIEFLGEVLRRSLSLLNPLAVRFLKALKILIRSQYLAN